MGELLGVRLSSQFQTQERSVAPWCQVVTGKVGKSGTQDEDVQEFDEVRVETYAQ